MSEVEKTILNAKDKLPEVTPTPSPQQTPVSSAQALKSRLEWGEPAFTVLDVRERTAFNASRIMGAMSMPVDELPDQATSSLDPQREIYIYADSEEQTTQAANTLRDAGFTAVSELRGGLAGWKAVGGPIEGSAENGYDTSGAEYNLKARLDKHAEVSSKNV